jgi:hypothetical protein
MLTHRQENAAPRPGHGGAELAIKEEPPAVSCRGFF